MSDSQARIFRGLDTARQVAGAMAKTSRPVCIIPVDVDDVLTAEHQLAAQTRALIDAARLPGMVRLLVVCGECGEDFLVAAQPLLAAAGVDMVVALTEQDLWPHGQRTLIQPAVPEEPVDLSPVGFDAAATSVAVTRVVRLVGLFKAAAVVLSEDDYPTILGAQYACADLGLLCRCVRVPVVRHADGSPAVTAARDERQQQAAVVLGAALSAAALVAEDGPSAVEDFARRVAGVEFPQAVFVSTDMQLSTPPEVGEGWLFGAIDVDGVLVRDAIAVPFGVGVRQQQQ